MKILTGIDIPLIPFGGSPIVCNDWYSDLPKGIQVRFLAMPPSDSRYNNWWSIKDVVLMNIEKKKGIEEFPAYVNKLKKEVKKQIEDFKPDIIHCQHINFGLSRAFADQDKKIPKIGICHGTDVQIATKSAFFLENMKYIRERMDILFFPAQKMADDYFKVDKCQKPYVVVPHGISDKAYVKNINSNFNWTNRPMKILYAGRLTSFKGPDIVVEAMKYLYENIRLTVIGGEDEIGYKERMIDIIQKNNLEGKITFVDHLPQENLWREFANFDLIVFPSRALEAFSLTTIEAQARGLPIAYVNAGGIENAIGESGIKVKENTPEAWADKIKEVYKKPEILNNYQKLGYINSEQHRMTKVRDRFFQVSYNLINSKLI